MSDSKDTDSYRLESKGPEEGDGSEGKEVDFVLRALSARDPHVVTLTLDKTVGDLAQHVLDKFGNVAAYFNTTATRINMCERFSYNMTLGVAFGPYLHGEGRSANVVNLYIFMIDTRGNPLFRVDHMLNARDTGLPWPPPNTIEPFNGGPIGTWTGWGAGPTIVSPEKDNTPSNLFGIKDEHGTVTLYNAAQLLSALSAGLIGTHPHIIVDLVDLHIAANSLPGAHASTVPVVDAATGDNVGFY